MDEEGGGDGRLPREVPSVALDQLFLEIHDQLPRDARGKLAQLADEVKKLTEASTAGVLETQPSSIDHAVLRQEEGTIEAKQSSRELVARGAIVTSLSDQPTLKDIVCFAVPRVAPKWYDVGLALDVQPFILETIVQEQKCPDHPRSMLVKWLQRSPGTGSQARTWQSVLDAVGTICGTEAVEDIRTAVQTLRIPTAGDPEESKISQHSSELEFQRKRQRSSTQSSEELELEQRHNVKKQMHKYIGLKMDLLAQDLSDLCFESDPKVTIKLLYDNALATISDLLEPHLKAVKKAAGRFHQLGLHQGAVAEDDVIGSSNSIDSLLSQMSVTRMWDKTRFLRKAVGSIPRSAPERGVAEAILSHYHMHLAIYERATLLKDALAKESKSKEEETAPREDTKLVPLAITSLKDFGSFTCEDCHHIQARILSTAYSIPEEKIICHNVEECQSTTVTFLIPGQFTRNIIQRSAQMPTVWILLEIRVIEVSIPGVFIFSPSLDCFLTLLRESESFTADLLGVTEVLPYQMYSLLDSDTKEPLSGRPLTPKRIEQHWDSHDELGSHPHSESEDVETLAMHSDEAIIPLEGTHASTDDKLQSKCSVSELEAKVKDLEQKVADLFMDNMALKTKLEAGQNIEKQQQEEITRLKERLVQALKAQETATQEQSLPKTSESQLEVKIKLLEEAKYDLEEEVEKLNKQMKQLEVPSTDTEQFTKPIAHQEPSTDELETVTGESVRSEEGVGKDPTREASTTETSSIDQQEAVKGEADVIREEARKGSTGETVNYSTVPDQLTGVPTAATRGSQPTTQVAACPPVVEAARIGQLSTVRKLLNGGAATVEDHDEEGMTALLWASLKGHLLVVRELVDVYKVNVFQKSRNGDNAMHAAAAGGQLEVIKFLYLIFGARAHEKTTEGSYTMLHYAAQEGHCEVARFLIEELKMDPQDTDKWGNTALFRAVEGGNVSLVRMLMEDFHCSLDEVNEDGQIAMHAAAQGGQIEVIKLLSPRFGAKVHEKDSYGYTMLHWAAQEGHCEVARYLIEELKMDPQDRDKWGTTALLRAAYSGNVFLVRMLLEEFDCSLDEVNNNGKNAMHMAAQGGHLEVIKFLTPMFGARVHEEGGCGETMLHWAAQMGHCEVAHYLIEELKMDPQNRDKWGLTVLLRGAYRGHVELVRMLLKEYRSSLDEMDDHGKTAVLETAVDGYLDLLRELVEHHGADMYHKAKNGANALHLAAFNGHLEVVKYLIPEFGQRKFDKDNVGETCLDWAVQEQQHNVVDYFIQEAGFVHQC